MKVSNHPVNIDLKSSKIVFGYLIDDRADLLNEIKFYKERNNEILNTVKILQRRKKKFQLIILIWFALLILFGTKNVFAQFNPININEMRFFVESKNIEANNHVAFCESDFCLNHINTEGAIITEQYCDVSSSCNEGCVRRWIDQSDYVPSGGFNPPEYTNGRNFGQDDNEKPCYVSDCINGKPCVRGGGPYGSFSQDKYLEIQIPDYIYLSGSFSIFLLAKPKDQTATGDWSYYGQATSFLRHDIANNKLRLKLPGNFVTSISTDQSIALENWQLIEVHRDYTNNITTFINGVNTSVGSGSGVVLSGIFTIGYLLSNTKTKGSFNATGMYGDVASFLVYNKKTTDQENTDIRDYFNQNYFNGTLDNGNVVINANTGFDIFPNPTEQAIQISNLKKAFVKNILIYDYTGRLVKSKIVNSQEPYIGLDISDLASSNYICNIKLEKGEIVKHLIKN